MKLVTGSSGFIGSNIEADLKWNRSACDLTDYNRVLELFGQHPIKTVVHCAARHGSALEMGKDHTGYIENNIICDMNIIKACRESGVENLLMLSTITSFDPRNPSPFTEQSINGEVNEKIFGYAYSKKICVGLCKAYQLDYGLNYKSIFLGNTYGPWGKFSDTGTVIHNLIYKFVKAKDEGTDVNLFGDGRAIRNYLYSEDLNFILDKLIENREVKDPVIVSNDVKISILDIVKIITEYLDFPGKINYDSDRIIGDQVKVVDNTNLKNIIGDFQFTDIETGIHKTIDWYLEHFILYDTIKIGMTD